MRKNAINAQELAGRALKAGHEVNDDAEEGHDNQGNGDVHEGMRESFDEWMVQGGLLVSHNDGSLRVESGNFRHGGESGEEQSTG
jgi:hypothetical protein